MKFVRDVFQAIQDMIGQSCVWFILSACIVGAIALLITHTMLAVSLCSILIIAFSIVFKMDNNKRGVIDEDPGVFFTIGLILAAMSILTLVFG